MKVIGYDYYTKSGAFHYTNDKHIEKITEKKQCIIEFKTSQSVQ